MKVLPPPTQRRVRVRVRRHPASWLMLMATAAAIGAQGSARAEDQRLGRLFFTPERRAALDHQRTLNFEQAGAEQGTKLTVNGVVRRTDGRSTVWINGVPHDEGVPGLELRSRIDRRDPSQVMFDAGADAAVSRNVGESFDRASRAQRDGLATGSITFHGSGNRPLPRP